MDLIDSHCHLDLLDLTADEGELEPVLTRARSNHVKGFLCVCVDPRHFSRMAHIAEQYSNIWLSVGLHPNERVDQETSEETFLALAHHPKVIAIGETGLDYYRTTDFKKQQERFRQHIQLAKSLQKPLIIHCREAAPDILRILREEEAATIGGIFHCFTENEEVAQAALELNFYISFSGIVTFKNAHSLQTLVPHVPLDRLLIETDAPYLAPVPHRGKPNEPSYVLYVAEKIAELKNLPLKQVAEQTTENFLRLFQLERSWAN